LLLILEVQEAAAAAAAANAECQMLETAEQRPVLVVSLAEC
jgi:hypothetical protein